MRRGPGPRVLYAAHELSPAMMRDVWCYRGVIDQAVGVSRLLAELLVRVGRLPAERVQRVPYGVRIPAEPNPPRSVDAPLRLGYVGRLDPAKRPLDLVALCDELDRVSLPYHLTILGRGELAAPLRERLAARIQRGTVTLRDPVPLDELYRTIYPALDCTLLFSRDAEGLPIAPMEAMAHGVLLATSDFRGRAIEGLIRHRRTALVFPVGDLRSAALELECVATRPDEWRRISLGGRHAVAQEYSFARMIERWAQVLDETVQRPPAAGPAPGAPIQPVGRLDRWLGVTMAETVRRLLRRRFVHPDPSEWPYCGEEGTEGVAATAAAMASVEQALLRDLAETGLAAPGSGENACPRCVRY